MAFTCSQKVQNRQFEFHVAHKSLYLYIPIMEGQSGIIDSVRNAARKKILFLPHAVRQMARPERLISPGDVRAVIDDGKLVEDYPDNSRGHSCLLLGLGKGNRAIHVVCAPKDDNLAIITAYIPDSKEWKNDFRTRRKE